MKKIIFVLIVVLLLNFSLIHAITEQEIKEAKILIDSKMDCKDLSNSQLEIIGEYYMEQMHPGEAHELMHQMMALKEGSEAEEQFHINMARTMYCGDGGIMSSGSMMGMMNMMGGNMMNGQNIQASMMGSYGTGWMFFGWIFWILIFVILVLLIAWLIKQIQKPNRR